MRLAFGLTLCLVAGCTASQVTQLADALKAGTVQPAVSATPPPAPSALPSISPSPTHIPMTPPPVRPSPSGTPPPVQPSVWVSPSPTGTAFAPVPFIGPSFGQTASPTAVPTSPVSGSPWPSPTPYPTPDPAEFFKRTIVSPPYQGPITITIDPGILGTASPAPFRFVGTDDGTRTAWQLLQPASGSDSVACDPGDPAQLAAKQIDPGTGDQVITASGMTRSVGGLTVPEGQGGRPFRYALDHLVVFPKAASDLPTILSLVGGTQRGDGPSGYYAIGVTPARGDLSRLAANLRLMSQYGSTPLTAITFSSVSSARVFALSLMLFMERTDLCWMAGVDAMAELP